MTTLDSIVGSESAMEPTPAPTTPSESGRGRVLLVTKTDFDTPSDGGTLRVSAIAQCLRAARFDVDAVSIRRSDGRRAARGTASAPTGLSMRGVFAAVRVALAVARVGSISVARWYSPTAAASITDLMRQNEYSAVLIEHSQLLVYRSLFNDVLVALDMHNVESELLTNYARSTQSRWRKALARYESHRVRGLELRARQLVDTVVTVSGHDAEIMRNASGDAPVVTAPNGVSDAAFGVTKTSSDLPTVVFVAHLGWKPNVDAAHWLIDAVWPTVRRRRPDARLRLIGRSPAKSLAKYDGLDGVTIHPDVPSTFPYLSEAMVATAPLRAAGGTRLKILESMATGTPVVSTSMGAMGLEHLASGEGLAIADTPHDFAEALLQRLAVPIQPETVRREVVRYRWTQALEPLVDVVRERRWI